VTWARVPKIGNECDGNSNWMLPTQLAVAVSEMRKMAEASRNVRIGLVMMVPRCRVRMHKAVARC
jgi:hypothetical protein